MGKKKVLIDLRSLQTPNCGFGQIAQNYAKFFGEVQRSGREQFDICFLLPRGCKPTEHMKGVKCYNYHTNRGWLQRHIPLLRHRLPKTDIWHAIHQLDNFLPESANSKIIFTIHDYNFLFEEAEDRITGWLDTMQKRIDDATAVTFISHFTEKQVSENSNLSGKITHTIYNGIESLVDNVMVRPTFVNDKSFFFAIGQFLPKKKFDLLLDVMKHFPEKMLYICGQNDLCDYSRDILKRIEDENLTNVICPGMVSNEERVWLFANCEAYLFPSIGEGFGLPAIEAMQFGKPVFASNYQSLPEIVGNHGYIWDTLEPSYMANTIKEGLIDFYKDSKKADDAKMYAGSFTYEKHIEAYLQLYRELLK